MRPVPLGGGAIVGKKQSRQNRGARTGGHDRSTTAESKQQEQASASHEESPIAKPESHRQPRKFGHN